MKRMRSSHLVCVCIFSFSVACFGAPTTPTVLVEEAKKSELFDDLTYPVRIVSEVQAPVLSDIDGVVRVLDVKIGQRVRAGQRLMALESTDPVYRFAKAPVEAAVSGVVQSLRATVGARVSRGQEVALIVDPSRIRIVAEIPSSDIPLVRKESAADFTSGDAETTFSVELVGVSPSVDPATGTATAEFRLSSKDVAKRVVVGGVGRIKLRVDEHKGVSVPEHAVTYRQGKTFLRVVRDEKASVVEVTLGKVRRGRVEVRAGLDEGSSVIVRSSSYISDGEQVKAEAESDAKAGGSAPKKG